MEPRYLFFIEINGVLHPVNPAFRDLKQDHEQGESVVLKETFSGTVTFIGKDFQLLLPLEQSSARCQELHLIIQRQCNEGYVEKGRGLILLSNGDWDLTHCRVTLKVQGTSVYNIIDQNKEKVVNLLDIGLSRVELVYGSEVAVLDKICEKRVGNFKYFDIDICGESEPGQWSIKQIDISGPAQVTGNNVIVTWIKPLDDTKLFTFLDPARSSGETLPVGEVKDVQRYIFDYLGSNSFRSNNRYIRLNDVLRYFATSVFNLNIKSDFFQINAENVSGVNYVTGEATQVAHLVMAQITDVQRPFAEKRATIANIKWTELWNDLVTLYNLDYEIENDTLIIEHISFFRNKEVQDITQVQHYQKWLAGMGKYSYNNDMQYPEEVWTMKNSIKNTDVLTLMTLKDHQGTSIYYNNGCTMAERGERKKEWKTEVITTDIYSILTGYTLVNANGEKYEKDPTSKDGLVLIAAEHIGGNQYRMLSEEGILDNYIEPNNCLSVAHIQDKYFRHNRSFRHGYMNDKPETFESSVKAKIGVDFKIPFGCNTDFDLDAPVKTILGTGEIQKSSFDYHTELLTLTVAYSTDEYETPEEQAPLVVNDNFEVKMELPTLLNVMANDVNVGDSTIEIVQQPLHASLEVVGSQVRYTGKIGYRNDFPLGIPKDTFIYRLKKGNVFSNNGLVSVVVNGLQNPFVPNSRTGNDGVLDDKYTMAADTVLTVNAASGVLSNDIFYNLNGTVKYKVTQVHSYDQSTLMDGTVEMDPDGSFVYTPSPGYVGIDEFEYIAYFPGYDPNQYSLYKKAKVRILVGNPATTHAFGEIINIRSVGRAGRFGDLSVALYYDADKIFPKTVTSLAVNTKITIRNTRNPIETENRVVTFSNAQRVTFETDRQVYKATESVGGSATNGYTIYVGTEPGTGGNNYEHHENDGR
ncbi:hypothetical protein FAZ19_16285 [Sphingobacterium alkalisoli]|uniref:Uncharacterized protein n=1 Tax=Sphingobacterium alkalisoli TaxID=1874115 RepID=A0A4U0GXD1_9SPHI|nr:Ig-like domain-containing protein [Sphingobacterium alkalisoli]TJY63825.1 hypothetical protein FAZ19_16285 [Sphingobacterium alkalisoli]GGH24638.1 hypothetical protein GCM10011418_32690 [Sphingobacterium alkalisoli]